MSQVFTSWKADNKAEYVTHYKEVLRGLTCLMEAAFCTSLFREYIAPLLTDIIYRAANNEFPNESPYEYVRVFVGDKMVSQDWFESTSLFDYIKELADAAPGIGITVEPTGDKLTTAMVVHDWCNKLSETDN